MANAREILDRMKSIQDTMKITNAMYMISSSKLKKAKPVLKKLPGWKCDIRGIRNFDELPENCRKYVEFIEEQIGFPITMVSNGPGREDIIYRESPLKK